MDDFSWRDMARATFAQCLPCLAVPAEGDSSAGGVDERDPRARLRAALNRNAELESLLADSEVSDGDALSLHSRIGRGRGGRRKKRHSKKNPLRLFGYDLFGRQAIALGESEDEANALDPNRRSAGRRHLDLSSSSLDSDPQPLTEARLAELSAQFEPPTTEEQLRQEEEEQRLKEERRAARKAKRASKQLTWMNLSVPVEGSPFDQGVQYSPYAPTPPMGADEFGPFEGAQISAAGADSSSPNPRGPGYEEEEVDGIDFGAAPYVTRPKGGSNRSGSDNMSNTQRSDPPVHPHQIHLPHSPTPSSLDGIELPLSATKKKRRNKHSKSTASSQSFSIASPAPRSPLGAPEEIHIREPVSPLEDGAIIADDAPIPYGKPTRLIHEL
jgi:hypothetical protein